MKEQLFYPLHQQSKKEISSIYNNRGFLYGDGFFETMRISNGTVPFFKDHCDRIIRSFELLKFRHSFSPDGLMNDLSTSFRSAGSKKDIRCRLTFFRMGNGLYKPLSNEPGMLLQLKEIQPATFDRNGIRACLYDENAKSLTPLSTLKSLNCLIYVLAGIFASGKHCDDALLANSNGNIIEATSSNLFLYKDNILTTPPLTDGCVNGIVRKNVIRIAAARGVKFREMSITMDDIKGADEIILTNALSPVKYIKRGFENDYSGEFASFLFEKLQESAGSGVTIL